MFETTARGSGHSTGLAETETRRRQMLDFWIGWLRLGGFLGLLLVYGILDGGDGPEVGIPWGQLAAGGLLYGSAWLIVMPRVSGSVHAIAGGLQLAGDALILTGLPWLTGLGPEVCTPLWTAMVVQYTLRFGWRGGAAASALAVVFLVGYSP